jgi:putative nucleotidyltransferase with HDIG domain
MTRPTLEVATATVQRLPNLPGSTRQLLGYLNDESVDLKIIVRAIECDQGLAIAVLRVANSPFYGMANKVQTIRDAVVVLGFSNLRMVIIAVMTGTLKFPKLENVADVRTKFRHSLAVAICASIIGRNNGLDGSSLFLAGILHDIGMLALMSTYPELHREAQQLAVRDSLFMYEAETVVFGFDHANIGASLCRHWNLPKSIVQAIGCHHQIGNTRDLQLPSNKADLEAGVIHVSDAIAHGLNLENDPHALVPPLADPIWNRLIGQQDALISSLSEIDKLYQELVVFIVV